MYTKDTLTDSVLALTADEQKTLFQVLQDNAELFEKVMPGIPLIQLIITGASETDHPLLAKFLEWKSHGENNV